MRISDWSSDVCSSDLTPRVDKSQIQLVKVALAKTEETIMGLLTQPRPNYTEAHVLLLVQMYGYKPGELLLLDRLQSVDLLLRRYIEIEDNRALLQLLRQAGRNLPDLYEQVLRYFVENVPAREAMHAENRDGTGSAWCGERV